MADGGHPTVFIRRNPVATPVAVEIHGRSHPPRAELGAHVKLPEDLAGFRIQGVNVTRVVAVDNFFLAVA